MTIPAGWYDDGSGVQRWWDGSGWTEHVAPDAAPALAPAPESTEPEILPFAPPYTLPTESGAAGASAGSAPVQNHPAAVSVTGYQGSSYPGVMPQNPGYPGSAFPPPGAGAFAAGAPFPQAIPRPFPWVGLSGLVAAFLGTVLACVPPVAILGWVLLGVGFVLSLVSLFLRARKWAGIAGLGVVVFGALLAFTITLVFSGLTESLASNDSRPDDSSASTSDGGETINVLDLDLGDCLPYLDGEGDVYELPLVPCDQPHDSEVYFVFSMPDDADYPGDDALTDEAISRCQTAFEEFVGMSYDESELDYWWFTPTKATWNYSGDRTTQCLVYSYDGDVTGTLEGAAR